MRRLALLLPGLLALAVAAKAPGVGVWSLVEAEKGPGPRVEHGVAALDDGFVVWGGCRAERVGHCPGALATGARFVPGGKGKWRPVTSDGAPLPREGVAVQGLGGRMVVWGGKEPGFDGHVGTGSVYDPGADVWKPMSEAGAPAARVGFSSVWTGKRWFVWGGFHHVQVGTRVTGRYLADGALYDPGTDTWSAVASEGAPTPRRDALAAWTGSKVVVWGGCEETETLCDPTGTGALYDPASNRWTAMSSEGAPDLERPAADPVYVNGRIVVFGTRQVAEGSARMDPTVWTWEEATNRWSWRDAAHLVRGRAFATPRGVLLVGADEAWLYEPGEDEWTAINDAPTRHPGAAMVWGARGLFVWGGIWTEQTDLGPKQPHPVDSGLLLELL